MKLEDHYAEKLSRTGCSTRNLRCRGLTLVLKDRFYHDYKFLGRDETPINISRDGMARGRRVDHEIQRWIKEKTHKSSGRGRVVGRAMKKPSVMHPFSRAFIELTKKLNMRPLASQVVVRDENCDIATLVDAVFLDERDKIILVELKCGFEGYVEKSNARMRRPFSCFPNSPRYQHQLQVCFTKHMFLATFPEFQHVEALVVRMTEKGAHVSRTDPKIEEIVKSLLLQKKKF